MLHTNEVVTLDNLKNPNSKDATTPPDKRQFKDVNFETRNYPEKQTSPYTLQSTTFLLFHFMLFLNYPARTPCVLVLFARQKSLFHPTI